MRMTLTPAIMACWGIGAWWMRKGWIASPRIWMLRAPPLSEKMSEKIQHERECRY